MLKEMERQGVKPKLLIGLTSSSSLETLQGCAGEAEAIIIPTSFAPVNPQAQAAADAVAKFNGSLDLHSGAAWENVFILKQVIEEREGDGQARHRAGRPREDPRRPRQAGARPRACSASPSARDDREAVKPYLFVHAKAGKWEVLHTP